MSTPASNRVGELVRGLLDRGYETATRQTLSAIASSTQSGIVAQRLAELDAEAARLAAEGQRLAPDNPVLRALVADLETELRRNASRIDVAGADLQQQGANAAATLTRELAIGGIDDRILASIGVRWNVPDPDAIHAPVNFANSPAWAAELGRYPGLVLRTVINQAIVGMAQGWGAARTAREIRRMTQGMTVSQANTLMRTIMLQSYRAADVAHRVANADILTEHIRIGVLDSRICPACLALHGTRLPIDARIDGHWNCRCTSISVVRGVPRSVQTGEDWLNAQPEESQRAILGDANHLAWKAGAVRLSDFVHTHADPTFGRMIEAQSLKGILGEAARQYYTR